MEYRQLGGSGVRVSALGLGGNNFGRYCDEARSKEVIHAALDLGVNHIDTAELYSRGVSEEFVGKAIAGRRSDVVLATKVGYPVGEGPNDRGASYRRVMAGCEGSLRRLGTDYIDLYYIHDVDPTTPLEETLRAYDDLVRQGKVRYVGISNHKAWQVCEALWICDRRGYRAPIVTQDRYNLLDRSAENELLPFCRAHRIGLVPWFPLGGGLLTGKYREGEPVPQTMRGYDHPWVKRDMTPRTFAIVARLEPFARERGHSPAELAIAWLLSHPEVPSVIAGATSPEQVAANVAATEWKLTGDDRSALDELLAAPLPSA